MNQTDTFFASVTRTREREAIAGLPTGQRLGRVESAKLHRRHH